MCVNYYSYLTTNQADVQPGWAKKDRFDSSNTTLSKIKNQTFEDLPTSANSGIKITLLKTISLNYLNNI